MRYIVLGILSLLASAPALWADDPPQKKDKADAAKENKPATPGDEYRAVVREFNKALQDFSKEYQKAKNDEDRNKLFNEKYPQPAKYAPRMMAIAEKYPKDPAAVEALVWVINNAAGPEGKKARELLVKNYLDSPKLAPLAERLAYSGAEGESLLRKILEKNPDRKVQGAACLSLAQYLKGKADQSSVSNADREKISKEAETLLERVVKEYGSVSSARGSLGASAKRELFELQNLAIGKTAPEISGEDTDGKKFALTDYRGKVVVLDFWGNW
jgi:hypothetical protein